jgi:integrase
MADEVASIRKRLRNSPRGGQAAASQSARLVSALFCFAQRRDPTLLGNPVSAVATADPKRHDLPALAPADMPAWWRMLQEIPREHHREAHLFTLLSGLRRQTVVSIQWQHVDLKRKCIRIERPKGGPERGFDLILSRAMIRCLWRARRVARRLYPEQAKTWVFAGPTDHVRGDALTKDGIMANHSLRRGYAVAATNAGVDEQTVGRLLNHGGKSITSRYIPSSHIGRMLAGAQEDTSTHIVQALGSPHGMT